MENHGKENCEKLNEHGKAWKSMVSYNLKTNHGKTMENHGKENYEKLNEHGKSKEKHGITRWHTPATSEACE